MVQNGPGCCVFGGKNVLADTGEQGKIAADGGLQIGSGDRGGLVAQHGPGLLRMQELLETALDEWVDGHDLGPASGRSLEGAEHARVVCAWILADDKDGIGLIEVRERDGPLPNSDGLG